MGSALAPSVEDVEQLDPCLRVEQAADVLGDLRDVLDDEQARLVSRWHRPDDTTRVGRDPTRRSRSRSARRASGRALDREQDGPLAAGTQRAHVVAAGEDLDGEPGVLREPRSSSADTSRSRSLRTQRRGLPWPPSSKIVVRVTQKAAAHLLDGIVLLAHAGHLVLRAVFRRIGHGMAAIAVGLHFEDVGTAARARMFHGALPRGVDGAHVHAIHLLTGDVGTRRRAWRNRSAREARDTDVPMA